MLISVILLVGGCGKDNQTAKETPKETPSKGDDNNGTKAKPVKELTLREKVVGTYEGKKYGDTFRKVLIDNGIFEDYKNDEKKDGEFKWKITKEGKLHLTVPNLGIGVWRINKDSSITLIAGTFKDGERKEAPKEHQITLKKIK